MNEIVLMLSVMVFFISVVFIVRTRYCRQKYGLIFDSSKDLLLIIQDGVIVDCNMSAANLFAVYCGDIIGRSILEFSPEKQPDGYRSVQFLEEIRDKCLSTGTAEAEWFLDLPQGRGTFVHIVFLRRGIGKKIYGIVRDIDYEKRLESQIKQSQKLEVVGLLAGSVAHDFNNKLVSILGNAELLLKKMEGDSDSRKYAELIMDGAYQARDLTKKITRFLRKDRFLSEKVNLHELIDLSVDFLEKNIDKKISIVKSFAASNAMVIGDSTLLQSLLLNLEMNAAEAMPNGGVLTFSTTNLELDSSFCKYEPFYPEPGMYIEISVADTGIGMSQKVMNRAFQPFYTTKSGGSAGLGLSAVNSVVKDHKGFVKIYSEEGLGTVVNLFFQVAPGTPVVREEKNHDMVKGSGAVMVVDDDLMVLETTSDQLRSLGFEVHAFSSASEALDFYRKIQGEVVFSVIDVNMSEINGLEAVAIIKKIKPDSRILLNSGFSEEFVLDGKGKIEGVYFIQKPFVLNSLSVVIKKIIS